MSLDEGNSKGTDDVTRDITEEEAVKSLGALFGDDGSSRRTDDEALTGLEALFGDDGNSNRADKNMASDKNETQKEDVSTISYVGGLILIIYIFAMMWSMLRISFYQFRFDIYSVGGALLIIPALICFIIGGGIPDIEYRKL